MIKSNCGCAHHFADAEKRRDPSQTTQLRKRFEADLVRRFSKLKGLINQSIVKNDALAIGRYRRDEALQPGVFAFTRSSDKVSMFMSWINEQQDIGILEVTRGATLSQSSRNAWSNVYVKAAYDKGVKDAAGKLKKGGANIAKTWTENAFNRPIHADRLALAYTRTYSSLEGITQTMDQQISQALANGLGSGKNPLEIARLISEKIDKIGINRARVLARTEVISAHAEAALNSYEEAGIEGVEVEAEFLTAGDERVCPDCDALSGKTFKISESRGVIPVHPQCRCAWSPLVVNGSGIELV